jgi:hypothetical protein
MSDKYVGKKEMRANVETTIVTVHPLIDTPGWDTANNFCPILNAL